MNKYILKYFFFLQIILLLAWFLGRQFLPVKDVVFSGKNLEKQEESSLIWSRANFDGVHYVTIARGGYGYLQQAFFPFYPKVIGFGQKFLRSYIVSGLFISNIFFILSMLLLAKILALEKINQEGIKKTLLFLFFFPTAFFFTSVYTESLFLFLVLASFYFARQGKFGRAGLIAGLASYTRLAGVFLLPALLTEYYQQASRRGMKERLFALKKRIAHPKKNHFFHLLKSRIIHTRHLVHIALSSWGLIVYMNYLNKTQGDPLYFVRVQPGFGAQRSVDKLILPYQVFWRYLKMIFTVYPNQWLYFNVWLEFLVALFFIGLLLWGWYKREEYKIRNSWLVFAAGAFVLPTLTGTFLSLPRFVLVCFPCFVVLSCLFEDLKKKKKWVWATRAYPLISLGLLIICAALFFRSYWIA